MLIWGGSFVPELLVYNYRIVVKNVSRKKIYQFSDTHLAEWDELSSEEEKEGRAL